VKNPKFEAIPLIKPGFKAFRKGHHLSRSLANRGQSWRSGVLL